MAYNKFIKKDGTVMLDLTDTTVSSTTLSKDITAVDKYGNKIIGTLTDSPLPIEVSTEEEMTALLDNGEVGSVYKYIGETGPYENDSLYEIVEDQLQGTWVFNNSLTTPDFVPLDQTKNYDIDISVNIPFSGESSYLYILNNFESILNYYGFDVIENNIEYVSGGTDNYIEAVANKLYLYKYRLGFSFYCADSRRTNFPTDMLAGFYPSNAPITTGSATILLRDGREVVMTFSDIIASFALSGEMHIYGVWQDFFGSTTCKTMTFTGGEDIDNPVFVSWVKANATKEESQPSKTFAKLILQSDLEEITITENGEYSGEYSKVTVEVEGGETSAGIIEVAELPTENIDENALYKVTNKTFTLGVNLGDGIKEDYLTLSPNSGQTYYVKTKPTENIKITSEKPFVYYVEDENDLFTYSDVNGNGEYTWTSLSSQLEVPFIGFANSIEEMSTIGLYVCNLTDTFSYNKYNKVSGKWYEYIDKSTVAPSYESFDLKFHNDDKLIEVFNRFSSVLPFVNIVFENGSNIQFEENEDGNFYFIYSNKSQAEIFWTSAEMTYGIYSLPKGFSALAVDSNQIVPLETPPTINNKHVTDITITVIGAPDSLSYVYPFNNYIYKNVEALLSLLGEITLH